MPVSCVAVSDYSSKLLERLGNKFFGLCYKCTIIIPCIFHLDVNNDLAELAGELKPIFAKWYELGLTLKIPSTQLKEIEVTHNKNPSRCMIDMLEAWFKQGSDKTRSQIVQALRSPLVGHNDVADEIKRKYATPSI